MDDFYKKRIIKKPRKNHYCAWCDSVIIGEHIYVVGSGDGEFFYARYHKRCEDIMTGVCCDCPGPDFEAGCMGDPRACYDANQESNPDKEV